MKETFLKRVKECAGCPSFNDAQIIKYVLNEKDVNDFIYSWYDKPNYKVFRLGPLYMKRNPLYLALLTEVCNTRTVDLNITISNLLESCFIELLSYYCGEGDYSRINKIDFYKDLALAGKDKIKNKEVRAIAENLLHKKIDGEFFKDLKAHGILYKTSGCSYSFTLKRSVDYFKAPKNLFYIRDLL